MKLKCPLCNDGREFGSLIGHISCGHKIPISSFKKDHPSVVLVSDETRGRTSATCKISCRGINKGVRRTEEQRRHLSETFSGSQNPFYGKKHSLATKLKMSKNHADFSGDKNPFSAAIKRYPRKRRELSERMKTAWARRSPAERERLAYESSVRNANSDFTKQKLFHRYHKCGFVDTKKAGRIFCRSSWEKAVADELDDNDSVLNFSLEKFVIPYFVNGKERHTRVDFLVALRNGVTAMVDVKPKALIPYGNNTHKLAACEHYCHQNGIKYFLLSANDMIQLRRKIKEFMDEC